MSNPHKSTRRDFLRGKAAADVLANSPIGGETAAEGNDLPLAAGTASLGAAAGYLSTISRRAMACEFAVLLNAGQYPAGIEAALAALDLVDQLEAQLSVFRDSSEVSRLNQTAYVAAVEVEPRLFALLKLAAEIHCDTAGAYDIATGPLTKLWGFYRRQGQMPAETELAKTMQHVGLRHVQFDDEKQTVRFVTPGVELNLGSIGKGYALDRAAELLEADGIMNFLLHGGNSSVLARGSGRGSKAEETSTLIPALSQREREQDGWWIGLMHPLAPERRIGEVRLHDRALGTSGSGTQFFIHDGHRYGHILDPRTGWPAEGTLSTTVAAKTGAEADALATAFYVLGAEAAIEYCRRHAGISAVMMSPVEGPPTAAHGRVEVLQWGWAEDEIRMYPDDSLSIRRIAD
ncbi:MAG TPA: FAD:protein FMN transferase [Pirellulales bacterium]|nr:FAD:protein FMN transferase [Pirellulales bacterium]